MLSHLDITIAVGYFVLITIIGLIASKKASKSLSAYFLGDRKIPWYLLGISGMATFIDISGTSFLVAYFFLMGLKGYWVCFQGAIALILAFLMIFNGKWMNRSGAMTNAEWMIFRFGNDTQGQMARILSALSAVVIAVVFIAYFYIGISKVLPDYIPLFTGPNAGRYMALLLFGLIMVYTMASGFYGVIYTDLIQAFLVLGIIGYITFKSIMLATPEYFASNGAGPGTGWLQLVPDNWAQWSSWQVHMPEGYKSMEPLGPLLVVWVIANIMQGFATPFDAWTSQRFYAAKNERESSLVAFQWIVLFSLRFPMALGFAVLALQIASQIGDPEMAVTMVIQLLIPAGLKGLVVAALLAAAMSTADSIVNSSTAYLVNDIYRPFIRPKANQKNLVMASYISTIGIICLGVIIGLSTETITDIWGWIAMGLFTGMLIPNILKWYWWRFNGAGYAGGMAAGIASAVIYKLWFIQPDEPVYYQFVLIAVMSGLGTIISVYAGKPADMDVLVDFYSKTRPFGAWGPVRRHCPEDLVNHANRENRRDLLLLTPACLWQVLLFLMMTTLVIRRWDLLAYTLAPTILLSIVLYKYWYKNLNHT
jgi:solute:Na+ symporter, SSS family